MSSNTKLAINTVPKRLFINGRWQRASTDKTLPVANPANGEILCEVSDAQPQDATSALNAAVNNQVEWARYAPRERGEILRRAYELLTQRTNYFATLMTLEMGKSLKETKAEVAYGAEFFRWFSEEAVRIKGDWASVPGGEGRMLTMKQPVGPCLLITPWNFPLAMGTRKIGPAIAAGCTMVIKPATETPLTMLALASVLEEVGLPPGVLNVICSSNSAAVTKPLIEDKRLRKLSFTGSTRVGRMLMEAASENILRLSMELGGNAPFVVFDDANIDDAVDGAVIAKMRNIGQSCVAANRFLVDTKVVNEFVEKLADKLKMMKCGSGLDESNDIGPLINSSQRGKIQSLVDDAVEKGARKIMGGSIPQGIGYFYPPTLLTNIPDNAKLLNEEIFGPVAAVREFSGEEEGIQLANKTEFGLVAYIYTQDFKRAVRVMEQLETGMVGVNQGMVSQPAAPFGGVKHSGFGREGGSEGIGEYLETKYCAVNVG